MTRLFVCLWPPDDVVARLEELHRKDQVGARFITPENWHITLRFLGHADPNVVADALDAGDYHASEIVLGPAVDLLGQQTLVVPAAGADELAGEVVRVTRDVGDPPPRRRFDGHLTIARLKKRANMPRALGELVTASWTTTEVALVASTLRPDGARYDTLATWPTGSSSRSASGSVPRTERDDQTRP